MPHLHLRILNSASLIVLGKSEKIAQLRWRYFYFSLFEPIEYSHQHLLHLSLDQVPTRPTQGPINLGGIFRSYKVAITHMNYIPKWINILLKYADST